VDPIALLPLPSGKHTKKIGKSHFFNGKSAVNGRFSIAM
jgi:hypothetical protein